MAWGRDNEELAIKIYTDVSSNKNSQFKSKCINDVVIHTNLDVKSFGLQVSPEKLWYGASPDSVTYYSCCKDGCLEVKCSLSLKEKSLKEEIHKGLFYVTYDSGSEIYKLNRAHQYYFQVQLEIYTLKVEFCNFMVWTPMKFSIIRIDRNDAFITDMLNKCDLFWFDIVLRYLLQLLTREHENENINDTGKIEDIPLDTAGNGCISNCKVTEACGMVGCDSCDNWYHLSCVKLKNVPKTKTWYCTSCRLDKKRKKIVCQL